MDDKIKIPTIVGETQAKDWFSRLSKTTKKEMNFPNHFESDVKYITSIYTIWLGNQIVINYSNNNEPLLVDSPKVTNEYKKIASETIKLSDEDAKIFVDALNNPPEPNEYLKKAHRDYIDNIRTKNSAVLSEWLTFDGYAVRVLKDSDPTYVENRYAMIEKTPRIRMEEFTDAKSDSMKWFTNGMRGSYDDKECRDWCDRELLKRGFKLL